MTAKMMPMTPPPAATLPTSDGASSTSAAAFSSGGITRPWHRPTATSQSSVEIQIHGSLKLAVVSWVYGDFADIRPKPRITTTTETIE